MLIFITYFYTIIIESFIYIHEDYIYTNELTNLYKSSS
jgi:hypothetical protein